MGSPSTKMRFRILLASFAALLLAGMISPSAAANNVEKRKLHRLETLGLDVQDPAIVQIADSAHALRSVDVFPKGDNINIVLQLSGLPEYNTHIYPENRRLVLDLFNTINIAPSSEFALGKGDPIRVVRNAQYSVDPSIVSRIVLELEAEVTPNVTTDGNNLVITTPMAASVEYASIVELPVETLQPIEDSDAVEIAEVVETADEPVENAYVEDAYVEDTYEQQNNTPDEMIVVPVVEVETETPEAEIVLALAVPDVEPAEAAPVDEIKEAEWAEASIEVEETRIIDEIVEPAVEVEEVNHIEELIKETAEVPVMEEPAIVIEEPAPVEMIEVEMTEVDAPIAEDVYVEDAFVEDAYVEDAYVEDAPAVESIAIETVVPDVEPEIADIVEDAPAEDAFVEDAFVEDAYVETLAEVVPEVIEIEEAPLELEPVEEIEVEETEVVEVEVVEMEVEDIEAADIEEAARELNGMFAEMAEEMESATPAEEEVEDAGALELNAEEAIKAFGEMFSEMAEKMKTEMAGAMNMEMAQIEAVDTGVAEEDIEVSGAVSPDEMLITLEFRDAELSAVLDILARKGNLNMIAGKGIKGKVTVRLVEVPLDVALNAILNVNGYGYLKTDNIFRILPISEIGDVVNLTTETYSLSYAQATDAKKTLDSFLTPNGNIEVDERTNMLVVTDIPANKDRLEKLITEIDRRVQQVLIEVIILDSVLLDNADLGVSWGLLDTSDRSPNSKEAARLGEEDPFPDQIGITLPTGANALNVMFGTLFRDISLDVFIDAMVSDTDTKVLANPKILTLNNETATIEIITEFPYNDVTQTSSGGQLSNITFKEIGTKLQVKPQITQDDHVILWVSPEQNSIAGTTAIGVPIVDTRRAETTLIVKNHQTIVMGGLRENRDVNTLNKVPFLGDLPGVKYAFRSVQSAKTDTELLVFLTVHIIESATLLPEEKIKAEELANLPRHPNSTVELVR